MLTIDPARGSPNALGLEGFGNVEKRVPGEAFKAAGLEPRGELYAAMLDTKRSWDELVLRHAPDEETAYRILENRLYTNITGRFVQSHDYIAMERLFDLHATGEYDLIVIDTPPTRNAIDFLEAPEAHGRVLRRAAAALAHDAVPRSAGKRGARVINVASRPFYQMADRILGSQFLQDIAEFFLNFQSMYDGFVERAEAVERLLHDRRTTFAVVTTLEGAPLREARVLLRAAHRPRLPPRRARAQQDAARVPALAPKGRSAADVLAAEAEPIAEALAGHRRRRRWPTRRAPRACCGRSASRSRTSRSSRRGRRSCEPSSARVPEVVANVPNFEVDIYDVGGPGPRSATHLFDVEQP